jgi:hypothetical protein
MRLSVEQIKSVSTKEVELLGVSSGSTTAAGSLDFLKTGVVASGRSGGGKIEDT